MSEGPQRPVFAKPSIRLLFFRYLIISLFHFSKSRSSSSPPPQTRKPAPSAPYMSAKDSRTTTTPCTPHPAKTNSSRRAPGCARSTPTSSHRAPCAPCPSRESPAPVQPFSDTRRFPSLPPPPAFPPPALRCLSTCSVRSRSSRSESSASVCPRHPPPPYRSPRNCCGSPTTRLTHHPPFPIPP